MAKPFKILRDKMSTEARQRSKEMADEIMLEMRLTELRHALGGSQAESNKENSKANAMNNCENHRKN